MDSTRVLIESLERLLSGAPTTCVDEFQVLEIRVRNLGDALTALEGLLEDVQNGIIRYERAVVIVGPASGDGARVSHVIRRDEADILLVRETLDEALLCDEHARAYEQAIQEQEVQFGFDPWQRYSLMQEIGDCHDCDVNTWMEVTLDKNHLERQFKERLAEDLPQFTGDLDRLRVFFWADLAHLYSMIEHNPLQTHKTIAEWGKPCLFICLDNAENDGADYFRSISAAMYVQREAIEPVLNQLLTVPSLQALTLSRQTHIQECSEAVGYLPPEYWLNAQVLAQAHTGGVIPEWFVKVAPFFIYSVLATVSSKVFVNQGNLRFEIEREFELALECSLANNVIVITQDSDTTRVHLTQEVFRQLLNFYSTALQAKYTAINYDLVQRAIVYGTSFAFETLFSKVDRIGKFYDFEYKHLLGDRFEQQSRTLRTFIGDMVNLRQRLASLVDSLSKDLSGLTVAVLATTALAIVARVMDIKTRDNLVIYGIVTAPVFAYLYITVFLLRIDNLKDLGERAVDEFERDMKLSQQIWDFPLHTIGVEEEDLDRQTLLKSLLHQHHVNQQIAQVAGMISHLLFVALAVYQGLWWLPIPKLIVDFIFWLWAQATAVSLDRAKYYSLVWLATLATAIIIH